MMNKRLDHNKPYDEIIEFFEKEIMKIITKDDNARFIFYNPKYSYFMDNKITDKILCLNDDKVISFLNDKIQSRIWFSKFINVPAYAVINGKDICYDSLKKQFINSNFFVVQECVSSGGNGTYILGPDSLIIFEDKPYLVSKFIENAYPINVHILVNTTTTTVFPISVQLIEKDDLCQKLTYKGSDFIAAEDINIQTKNTIYDSCQIIGNKLRDIGYKGVAGLDFIVSDNRVTLIEINPRFQASSELINRSLSDTNESLQHYNLKSFLGVDIIEDLSKMPIKYSSYVYNFNVNIDKLQYKYNQLSRDRTIEVVNNGFQSIMCVNNYDDSAYAYHIVCNHNLCSIDFQNNVRIFDNIRILSDHILSSKMDIIHYKIAILNQGIVISENAQFVIGSRGLRAGVFSSIDIKVGDVYINCPVGINHSNLSPFSLDYENEFIIKYYNDTILSVEIYRPIDLIENGSTTTGVPYKKIALVSTDRLRLRYESSCIFKDRRCGCKFCEAFPEEASFSLEDLYETYDACSNLNFRHILIGGGSGTSWEKIKDFSRYIKNDRPDISISLMSTIPPKEELKNLKLSGISEVSFNMEIFDEVLAKTIMPGKGNIPRSEYYNRLHDSVHIFGKNNVRSMIVIGFDREEDIYIGIEKLCRLGVQPVLSIFRPMPNTPFEYFAPVEFTDLLRIYTNCKSICDKYCIQLGPNCPPCQNNVLALPGTH